MLKRVYFILSALLLVFAGVSCKNSLDSITGATRDSSASSTIKTEPAGK